MNIILKRVLRGGLLILFVSVLSASKNSDDKPKSLELNKREITKSLIRAMKWQEANPIFAKAPTDWTNGVYYIGVTKAHEETKEKEFKKALIKMANRNNWQPYERFYHADDLTICYPYIYLKSIGAKNVDLEPTKKILNDHLYKPHSWKDGSEGGDKLTLWYWCDALFMTPPVITFYAKEEDKIKYLDDMYNYYKACYDLLYNKEDSLFARDLRFVWKGEDTDMKEKNGEPIFWSRGNGWVLGGLALLLDKMPENYSKRSFYEDLYKKMSKRILNLQPKDGLWRTSLLYPEAYDHGEVSGSGLYVFALAWGVNNGLLNKQEYMPGIMKGWKALQQCQFENGKVGWVQSIGASPEPAKADSWQNYGTGAFLLAGSELLKFN